MLFCEQKTNCNKLVKKYISIAVSVRIAVFTARNNGGMARQESSPQFPPCIFFQPLNLYKPKPLPHNSLSIYIYKNCFCIYFLLKINSCNLQYIVKLQTIRLMILKIKLAKSTINFPLFTIYAQL